MKKRWWMAMALGTMGALGAAELMLRKKGDADLRLDFNAVSERRLYNRPEGGLCLEFQVPFVHHGQQQACLIDASARVAPEGDRYKGGRLQVSVNNLDLPRDDGYFEGIVIKLKDKGRMQVRIHAVADDGDAASWLRRLGRIRMEFLYRYYGRSPMRNVRTEYVLDVAPFLALEPQPLPAPPPPPSPRVTDPMARILPIRTHLMRPGEDIVDIIRQYVVPHARKGDIVCIAESALAIVQGRVAHVDDIQPRFLATRLNRAFAPDSSLSSCYALEMAFREVGVARILLATAAAAVGKIVGRAGDFYRVAGPDVATIDDCTGTLPPYDKYVVMGPARSHEVVLDIKARTGLEAAIVDANDLHKCQVLAASDPSLEQMIHDSLLDNPQGNANEQTPIVLIRQSAPVAVGTPT